MSRAEPREPKEQPNTENPVVEAVTGQRFDVVLSLAPSSPEVGKVIVIP
ncbi:hypothetical protein [Nocardia sp. NPDC003979]